MDDQDVSEDARKDQEPKQDSVYSEDLGHDIFHCMATTQVHTVLNRQTNNLSHMRSRHCWSGLWYISSDVLKLAISAQVWLIVTFPTPFFKLEIVEMTSAILQVSLRGSESIQIRKVSRAKQMVQSGFNPIIF